MGILLHKIGTREIRWNILNPDEHNNKLKNCVTASMRLLNVILNGFAGVILIGFFLTGHKTS